MFFEILLDLNDFPEDCETVFNLAGGIYPETTRLIQDGTCPSFFRDQEIHLLYVLEYNPCQAVLALESCPEKSYLQKQILGVFIRMALICSTEEISEVSQGLTGVLPFS